MNAPVKITADREAINLATAKRMHEAAGNLLAALTKSGGRYSTRALRAEIALCETAVEMWDDGDARVALENLRHELPEDEPDGFDPSRVHPDDPCQGKGFL